MKKTQNTGGKREALVLLLVILSVLISIKPKRNLRTTFNKEVLLAIDRGTTLKGGSGFITSTTKGKSEFFRICPS